MIGGTREETTMARRELVVGRCDTPRFDLWQRLKSTLIAAVSDDLAICEFECSKANCRQGEWATCERRIKLQSQCRANQADTDPPASGAG
jgi:hypothetical protein